MKIQPLVASDPRHVHRYRLAGRIGEGGMGIVYAATSADHPRVALKVIRRELRDDPMFRLRFGREVGIAQSIQARCTARVLEASLDGPSPFLAVEFVDGPTLAEYIETVGVLSESQVVVLGAGLAEGLAAIHAAGVVHRDLSPQNVILSPDGPKLIDFGIARREDVTTVTDSRVLMGTPSWMAPEQITGGPTTAASDIFAWGALVAYASTGRRPFEADRPEAVTYRIVHGSPGLEGVPGAVASLVRAALDRDPSARPSAVALFHELLGSRDDAQAEVVLARLLAESWTLRVGSEVWPTRNRRRLALACVAFAVVAGVIGGGIGAHALYGAYTHPAQNLLAARTTTTSLSDTTTTSVSVSSSATIPTTAPKIEPSVGELAFRLDDTVETSDRNTHFSPRSDPVVAPDGTGGWLTAVIGVRFPSADGKGQLVFFWHNTKYIGWDTNSESIEVVSVTSPSVGVFVVKYAHYAAADPLCCPSLQPIAIRYHWNGTRMVATGTPPVLPGSLHVTVTTLP